MLGCGQEVLQPDESCNPSVKEETPSVPATSGEGRTILISATTGADTKATAQESGNTDSNGNKFYDFVWQKDDAIALVTEDGQTFTATYNGEADTKTPTFKAENVPGIPAYVVYPADDVTIKNGILTYPVSIDGYTSGRIVTPMIAGTEPLDDFGNVKAKFEHLCGLVQVNISDMPAGITRMVFTANDNVLIGGTIQLTDEYNGSELTGNIDRSGSSFTFNLAEATAANASMTFYVPVAAGTTFTTKGFKVELYKEGESNAVLTQDFPFDQDYTLHRAHILLNANTQPTLEFAEGNRTIFDAWGGLYNGGNQTVVKSNIDYEISSDKNWVIPIKAGDNVYNMDISTNYNILERYATVKITPTNNSIAAQEQKTIKLTQYSFHEQSTDGGIFIKDYETGSITLPQTAETTATSAYYKTINDCKNGMFTWYFSNIDFTEGRFYIEYTGQNSQIYVSLYADGKITFAISGEGSVDESEATSNVITYGPQLSSMNNLESLSIHSKEEDENNDGIIEDIDFVIYVNGTSVLFPKSKTRFDRLGEVRFLYGPRDYKGKMTINSFTIQSWK